MRIVKIFLEGEWWWGVEVKRPTPQQDLSVPQQDPPSPDPSSPLLHRVFDFYRLGKNLRDLCPTEEELEHFAVKESCPAWLRSKSKPKISLTLDELLEGA